MKKKGMLITVEGVEGVGKSTSIHFIENFLTKKNIAFTASREPGGTPIAEAIRQLVLHNDAEQICHDTELLLIFAARAQHLAQVIMPALSEGRWVVCDRFTDATYAYQGGGRNIPVEKIAALENLVQGNLRPDLTFLLDAPLEVALARAKQRSEPDRIEREKQDFFQRVREAYLARVQQFPQRFVLINAQLSPEAVQQQLQQQLEQFFKTHEI